MNYPKGFIEAIPKTDLHLHLDGSMRIPTLIEMAKERKIELPSFTEEGLRELVFKENYKDLNEYLTGFGLTGKVMQDGEGLHRIAYELALDNFAEGVRYIEVRFAPQLHINSKQSFEDVMESVDSGFRKARAEINHGLPDDEPPFDYGIIVCAMRFFNEHFSEYYKKFCEVHKYSSTKETMRYASLELARAAVKVKEETNIQVVGFDLAGSEHGYPASNHYEAYYYAHKHFLKKTVHAGEAFGPDSIFQAITKLNADRIGHGLHLFNEDMVSDKYPNKKRYVEQLANYIAERRTTIEVCLTSNRQTVPELAGDITKHSLKKMLDHRLSVTFCTDNRLVSNTTVTNEIQLALDNFDITPKQLKNIIVYGFKRSFFHAPYPVKREYVRRVINYYEKIAEKFGVQDDE